MAAEIENLSGKSDTPDRWKTYYLRIRADGDVFYKIGKCNGLIARRYSREPLATIVQIIKIWEHPTQSAAERHEESLFKRYAGDKPYIGRCGPLQFGGNTETFSHDVIGGEIAPHSFVARMYSLKSSREHAIGYSARNPKARYSHLSGQVNYMKCLFGPDLCSEGDFLQIPKLSAPDRVVIATEDYLNSVVEGLFRETMQKKIAIDAIDLRIVIRLWSDYTKMVFEGKPFKVDRWTDWVYY